MAVYGNHFRSPRSETSLNGSYRLLVIRLPTVVGMKSPGDVRVGESPSLDVGRLHSRFRSDAPKKRRTAPRHSVVREVKCAALR